MFPFVETENKPSKTEKILPSQFISLKKRICDEYGNNVRKNNVFQNFFKNSYYGHFKNVQNQKPNYFLEKRYSQLVLRRFFGLK